VAWAKATTLPDLLDIEELDRNLYRGTNEAYPDERPRLFGGQVLAQALRAAAYTVPDGRPPHSCHGYFLRPGRGDRPVILRVERDRDGRSFSARHVVALQDGDEIFTVSASFHHPEDGGELGPAMPEDVPPPDSPENEDAQYHRVLDVRILPGHGPAPGTVGAPSRVWARSPVPLGDDPIVHACALAYMSDIGSGFVNVSVPRLPKGGPSLDHALWFHHQIRLDEWTLLDLWPVRAGGGCGLYLGTVHAGNGQLGAFLAQESLLRPETG